MKVKYVGPHEEVEIGDHGIAVRRGDTVEVPDELGERLLEQTGNWEKAAGRKAASEESE